MKTNFSQFISIVLVAILLNACSNNSVKNTKYIPKDITAVIAVDPKNMADKLEKAGINVDTLINKLFKTDAEDLVNKTKFFSLRDSSGINWNEKIYIFVLNRVLPNTSQANVFNVMGRLKDAKTFEAYLVNQADFSTKKIERESNYSYLMNNDGSMISWDEKTVIATRYERNIVPVYDTIAMKFIVPEKASVAAELKKEVDRYYHLKESESIVSVTAFVDLINTKSDGFAFTTSNNTLNLLSSMPLQLPKLEELLKDNYLAASLNFDDGKIVATTRTYTNPLLSSILKKYAGPTVNLSLIDHYPSENINMIMLASFNPQIFGGLLKELEIDNLVNGFMEKTGFSAQDLYKCLKGDIAVVISDLGRPENRKTDSKNTNQFNISSFGKMVFNAPVGDAVSFTKIMNKAADLGYVTKTGNSFKAGKLLSFLGMYLVADEKNFVIASDSLTYMQYVSNKNKPVISNDALNQFKGKSTLAYFDITNTIASYIPMSNGGFKNSMITAKNTFKDMMASSENFDGKSVNGKLEIRLNNQQQNSLVTLAALFSDIVSDMRESAKADRALEDKFISGAPSIIRTN